jgi:hypothetical protein
MYSISWEIHASYAFHRLQFAQEGGTLFVPPHSGKTTGHDCSAQINHGRKMPELVIGSVYI